VPDGRLDQVRGRLDAVLVASRVAPTLHSLGVVPTATTTHTEPFHVSKAIATLDYVSSGRAGWRAQLSRPGDNPHFGRRPAPVTPPGPGGAGSGEQETLTERFEEAADFVEVVRRLWDSWEDDAEIRDVATGRFVDRDKLHYIDFEGRWFSVRGPSIVPRPPQGQPIVTALAHAALPYRFAAGSADVVYVTPRDEVDARSIVEEVVAEQFAAGRGGETVHVFGDLGVVLDHTATEAAARRARLDEVAGADWDSDTLQEWQAAGLSGFRLRPATIPDDLEAITRGLVPELQRRGVFRSAYEASTLRQQLGLPRPANRYAGV